MTAGPGREVVRLPVGDRLAPVLDEIALAYATDPTAVGRLLTAHAVAVVDLDVAEVTGAPDWECAVFAANAGGTRAALFGQSMTAAASLDLDLTPDEADDLAERLLTTAAKVRRRNARKGHH